MTLVPFLMRSLASAALLVVSVAWVAVPHPGQGPVIAVISDAAGRGIHLGDLAVLPLLWAAWVLVAGNVGPGR